MEQKLKVMSTCFDRSTSLKRHGFSQKTTQLTRVIRTDRKQIPNTVQHVRSYRVTDCNSSHHGDNHCTAGNSKPTENKTKYNQRIQNIKDEKIKQFEQEITTRLVSANDSNRGYEPRMVANSRNSHGRDRKNTKND